MINLFNWDFFFPSSPFSISIQLANSYLFFKYQMKSTISYPVHELSPLNFIIRIHYIFLVRLLVTAASELDFKLHEERIMSLLLRLVSL